MNVEFLGTGGYHPDAHRHTTCVLLPDRGLCIDAGSAFFRAPERLAAHGVTELDLVLTHAHLDHVMGLTFPLAHIERGTLTAVRIHGRREKLDAVREHLFACDLFPVLPPIYSWHPLPEKAAGTLPVADGLLHFREQVHPGGSLGLRFETGGKRFVFCTDTAPAPETAAFAADADLFVHECNFPDGWEDLATRTGHSTLSPVLDLARHARAQRTLLVHVSPDAADPADPVGLGEAHDPPPGAAVAVDGLRVTL
ncbi:MBL fold metallo-hydrolase [Alienimonas californiensis]|uniref:Ribonuclease Z n=1 Tax=Alienimonas californiensis TaxID=2527989 RepID=A0A517PF24_9PLAN|nr:MBL fold metallo-hydrolase [Alienimonas californiensis]QDT17981.1 ribonuclease Z [Alienimonas californiensis]